MLFDKNGIYYMDDSPKYYDFAIDIMNNNKVDNQLNTASNTIKLFNPDEALKRGNAFPNLYDAYKNYAPGELKADNAREALLLEIQMLDFTINDLNLYLDLYPNDNYAFQIFKKYVSECKQKKEDYTRKFGPLVVDSLTDRWAWSKGIWPWEEGNKYV